MKNYFQFYQKYQKKNQHCCNFYQFFKILLANYDDSGKCVLNKAQKRLHSFYDNMKNVICKMITFLDFEKAANECAIVFLNR